MGFSMAEARCDPGGLLAVIGQRLGSGDLYAHCLAKVTYDVEEEDYDGSDVTLPEHIANKEPTKSSKYKHIIYQAYYPELDSGPASRKTSAPAYPNGPLLDPKRLSWKDLSYLRYNSPEKFRVIYQQEDLAGDTYLIDRTWITGGIGTDGVLYQGCVDGERQHGTIPPGLVPPVISIVAVDPSPTQFWALIWILYQPTTNLYYVIDIERVKLTAEELLGYNTTIKPILRNHGRMAKQVNVPRLPDIALGSRNQRSPKIPVSTRLRTQMASPTRSQRPTTHHHPKQTRRKHGSRSPTTTTIPFRCGTFTNNACELENVGSRGRTR
jgi:hypothetical protein